MGSKRSSKNPTNVRSSTPPADPPVDGNEQNPKNSSLATPSKSRKKPKLSAPISTDSSIPSTDGEVHSENTSRKGKAPELSNEISPSDGAASRSSSLRWGESDNLKLLKSVTALWKKGGFGVTPANIVVLLKEIKDWAPSPLSEKNLNSKLRHLRFKFQKSPMPGPESSEFDRSFHELSLKVWGPEVLKPKSYATGGAKDGGRVEKKGSATGKRGKDYKKPKGDKIKVEDEKEDDDVVEEEERGSENDEDTDEKTEKNMILENGEEHEKDELLVDEDNGLLDPKEAGYTYKYLRIALEEYWTDSKLNMDTLHAALPKVNPVQAKRLDEDFREVFVGILKLKMEKNEVSNEIIRASLGC